MSTPVGHDMSRFWRLVSIENGRVTGTAWVTRPTDKGEQHVKAVDLVVWSDDQHHTGITVSDLTAFVRDGVVDLPRHMIQGPEWVQAEVWDQVDAVKAAMLAASITVVWPAKDEGNDHE